MNKHIKRNVVAGLFIGRQSNYLFRGRFLSNGWQWSRWHTGSSRLNLMYGVMELYFGSCSHLRARRTQPLNPTKAFKKSWSLGIEWKNRTTPLMKCIICECCNRKNTCVFTGSIHYRYKVMKDCWKSEPGLRPSFADLAEKMGEELQEGEKEVE